MSFLGGSEEGAAASARVAAAAAVHSLTLQRAGGGGEERGMGPEERGVRAWPLPLLDPGELGVFTGGGKGWRRVGCWPGLRQRGPCHTAAGGAGPHLAGFCSATRHCARARCSASVSAGSTNLQEGCRRCEGKPSAQCPSAACRWLGGRGGAGRAAAGRQPPLRSHPSESRDLLAILPGQGRFGNRVAHGHSTKVGRDGDHRSGPGAGRRCWRWGSGCGTEGLARTWWRRSARLDPVLPQTNSSCARDCRASLAGIRCEGRGAEGRHGGGGEAPLVAAAAAAGSMTWQSGSSPVRPSPHGGVAL